MNEHINDFPLMEHDAKGVALKLMKREFKLSMRECYGNTPIPLEQLRLINKVWCLGYISALQYHLPQVCHRLEDDLNKAYCGQPIVDETWFWWNT